MCERSLASHMPPTGGLAGIPGMCSDWESNWKPFGLQASAQSAERTSQGSGDFSLETAS